MLSHPELPPTNNAAERALRHWIILRTLGLGACAPVGSRVFALIASVIDTCCQRGHVPWRSLERAIADRRRSAPGRLAPVGGRTGTLEEASSRSNGHAGTMRSGGSDLARPTLGPSPHFGACQR